MIFFVLWIIRNIVVGLIFIDDFDMFGVIYGKVNLFFFGYILVF